MNQITRKPILKAAIDHCLTTYRNNGLNSCAEELYQSILTKKVKFPLLEYCGRELYRGIDFKNQSEFCELISAYRTIGGNVIIAIILQEQMAENIKNSMDLACHHIEKGAEWYVTDIIGERIFGVGLLQYTNETLAYLYSIKNHSSYWVIRSIGPGVHYATKKGLAKKHVVQSFLLLLELAKSTQYHVKTGIGWAAKTIAKYHPDIIDKYQSQLDNRDKVGRWFTTKIKIGLQRNAYANRD